MKRLAALAAAVSMAIAGALGACMGGDPFAERQPASSPSDDAADDVAIDAPFEAGPVRADFGLDVRPANTTCHAPARPPPAGPVALRQVQSNLSLLGPTVA